MHFRSFQYTRFSLNDAMLCPQDITACEALYNLDQQIGERIVSKPNSAQRLNLLSRMKLLLTRAKNTMTTIKAKPLFVAQL
jgi:hypothetical protein